MTVVHKPSDFTKEKRSEFKGKLKREFTALAIDEICGSIRNRKMRVAAIAQVLKFECHHIIPLSLGGTNDFTNVALVAPALHKDIHEYIEAQGRLKAGQQLALRIPIFRGKVWGLVLGG
jgi:hypothetical protein